MAVAESPAQARVLFREVNERIRSLHGRIEAPIDFVCECDDPGCFAVMRMTSDEYRDVRDRRAAQAILPGHPAAGTRVTLATDRFMVCEPARPS